MTTPSIAESSLDELAALGAAGNPAAEQALFENLRVSFVQIAKRRVRADDVEDVAQEALGIVHAKYAGRGPAGPILTWGLAILRNVIGNYYQRRERQAKGEPFDEGRHLTAVEGYDRREEDQALRDLLAAIDRLARHHARCAVLFRRIMESLAEGGAPTEVTHRAMERMRTDYEAMSPGALYVALHRCRAHLRAILAEGGALTGADTASWEG